MNRKSLPPFLAAAVLAATLAAPAHAQMPPTPEQMIEQLRAPAAGAPRTRSLRNLSVEPVGPRPSLSLLIQFDFDSARLRDESRPSLDNLASALHSQELKDSKFTIEGHTDAKGSPAYNQRLSQQRAETVLRYLALRGVQAERMAASGKGSAEPANPADPLAAENRRVRIVNTD